MNKTTARAAAETAAEFGSRHEVLAAWVRDGGCGPQWCPLVNADGTVVSRLKWSPVPAGVDAGRLDVLNGRAVILSGCWEKAPPKAHVTAAIDGARHALANH